MAQQGTSCSLLVGLPDPIVMVNFGCLLDCLRDPLIAEKPLLPRVSLRVFPEAKRLAFEWVDWVKKIHRPPCGWASTVYWGTPQNKKAEERCTSLNRNVHLLLPSASEALDSDSYTSRPPVLRPSYLDWIIPLTSLVLQLVNGVSYHMVSQFP